MLNSRPLTYVSSEDIEEPLTPSHLKTGRRLLSIPDEIAVTEEKTSEVSLLTERALFTVTAVPFFEPLEARVCDRDART